MLGGLTDGISRAEANLRALPYSLRPWADLERGHLGRSDYQ